jgi:Leucine-rich repeat (LRR) protein
VVHLLSPFEPQTAVLQVMDVEIGELRNLEALQMEGNQMEYPFHNLYDRHPLLLMYFHNVQMVELDLSGIDLTLLPPVVGRLTALKALDLSRNRIEQVCTQPILPITSSSAAKISEAWRLSLPS